MTEIAQETISPFFRFLAFRFFFPFPRFLGGEGPTARAPRRFFSVSPFPVFLPGGQETKKTTTYLFPGQSKAIAIYFRLSRGPSVYNTGGVGRKASIASAVYNRRSEFVLSPSTFPQTASTTKSARPTCLTHCSPPTSCLGSMLRCHCFSL